MVRGGGEGGRESKGKEGESGVGEREGGKELKLSSTLKTVLTTSQFVNC